MAYSEAWARIAREAIGSRSQKQIAIAVGRSQALVNYWTQGQIPKEEDVRALAGATGYDLDEMLFATGYFNPDTAFNEGVRALAEEFRTPIRFSTEDLPLRAAGPADVKAALEAIRRRLEKQRDAPDRAPGGSGP